MPSRRKRHGHSRSQRRAAGVGAGRLMRNPDVKEGGLTPAVTPPAVMAPRAMSLSAGGPAIVASSPVASADASAGRLNVPPHFVQPLLKTPFHNRARALSQLDSFIPWSGYTTVDVFTNVEQEYFAIRNATTLYDLTPMVKYRIPGPPALPFLNRLVPRDIAN